MKLDSIQPHEIIVPDWLNVYYKYIKILTAQIVDLNTTLFALEKITNFPYDLLQCDRSFWSHFSIPLVDQSILIIWRIAVDKSSGGLSVSHLKNEVIKNLQNNEFRKLIAQKIEEGNYENGIKILSTKVQAIRHKFISHFSLSFIDEPIEKIWEETSISLEELQYFRDIVEGYFRTLCFGYNIKRLKYEYIDGHIMQPINIEEIFDTIAKSSIIINLQESDLNKWKIFRKSISQEQIDILNDFRVKFGLQVLK